MLFPQSILLVPSFPHMKRRDFYQFLYHMTSVVIFQVKSCTDSTLCCFVGWELVSTPWKKNPAFYLVIIQSFLNFTPILRGRSVERKILTLEDFSFFVLEVLKVML